MTSTLARPGHHPPAPAGQLGARSVAPGRIGEPGRASASGVPAGAESRPTSSLDSVDRRDRGRPATVRAPWAGECRRCLRPVDGELIVRGPGAVPAPGRRRARDDDEETYPLERGPPRPGAAGARRLLLELPLAPLCRQDCAGLCPTCGADLQPRARAAATPRSADPRWAALDVLRCASAAEPGRRPRLPGRSWRRRLTRRRRRWPPRSTRKPPDAWPSPRRRPPRPRAAAAGPAPGR